MIELFYFDDNFRHIAQWVLLPNGSEERGVLGVGSIPVAILPSCQNMKLLHHNCIEMNKVW